MNRKDPVKSTEVYIDLDGVLADFFSEYAKLAGIQSGNYRDIPPAKTDPTLNKMIGTDFFARLPKFPSADQLIKITVKLFGRYHICSSPLRGDHENTEIQKKEWIKKHLSPPPATIIITPNKAKYAVQPDGTPNILVDDRGSNISAWEAKGGIGIKYQADEDGLEKVIEGFARARKILRGELEHEPQTLTTKNRSTGQIVTKSGHNDADEDDVAEADDINPRFQQNPIMANEAVRSNPTGIEHTETESYGPWIITTTTTPRVMGKITNGQLLYVAKIAHKKEKNRVLYATGKTQGEATDAAIKLVTQDIRSDNPDDYKTFIADLNSPFHKELYDPHSGDYFKISRSPSGPVLIMLGPEWYKTLGSEVAELGFKKAANRTENQGKDYVFLGFTVSPVVVKTLGLIPNMRYGLEFLEKDDDGNSVFKMIPDSRAHGISDKQRLPFPALTLAATGKVDLPNIKESASSGATSAGAVASAPAQGGGWLFGGTVGAPKTKKKKAKVLKR